MADESRSRGKVALERLDARLVEIRAVQRRFTAVVLFGFAIWYGVILVWFKGDVAKANFTFTNSFQFMAVAWCCWFMLPYFLRMEAKQDVGLAMGHDSVDVLDKIDLAIEARVQKLDDLLARADKALSPGLGDKISETLDAVRDDMKAIRRRIERDTDPLPAPRRPANGSTQGPTGTSSVQGPTETVPSREESR